LLHTEYAALVRDEFTAEELAPLVTPNIRMVFAGTAIPLALQEVIDPLEEAELMVQEPMAVPRVPGLVVPLAKVTGKR
jgi:hypothetical protein